MLGYLFLNVPWQSLYTAVLISWSWSEFPFIWFSLQLGKATLFPFKADNFVHSNLIMDIGSLTILQKNPHG